MQLGRLRSIKMNAKIPTCSRSQKFEENVETKAHWTLSSAGEHWETKANNVQSMLFLCIALADDYTKIEEHMNEMKTTACSSNLQKKDIAVMSTSKCTHMSKRKPASENRRSTRPVKNGAHWNSQWKLSRVGNQPQHPTLHIASTKINVHIPTHFVIWPCVLL
jgi:hypothetical protein